MGSMTGVTRAEIPEPLGLCADWGNTAGEFPLLTPSSRFGIGLRSFYRSLEATYFKDAQSQPTWILADFLVNRFAVRPLCTP